jgi:phage-related protein
MMAAPALPSLKPIAWIGSSKGDLRTFPEEVKDSIGFALYVAQQGGKHIDAKSLRGFGGAGVLEIIEDHHGDTYRAIYTVRLAGRVYVLHAFQKKSKTGIQTPNAEINLIKSRLKRAEQEHIAWLERREGRGKHG